MKPRGRHAAPGPADRTHAALPAAAAGTTDATEVLAAVPVEVHSAARRKLAKLGGKSAALIAVGLVLAAGVINMDASNATVNPAALAGPAYLDLRADELSSRTEVDRSLLNEDRVAVTIEVDGESVDQVLTGGTVRDALDAAGIALGAADEVSEHLETLLVDGQQISIKRVTVATVSEEVIDAHTSSTVDSNQLYKGEERVTTAGVDGHSVTTFRITYVDGEEIEREALAAVVSQERVDEVIAVGTKERPAPAASARSNGPVATGSNREIGQSLAAERGWTGDEWTCLDALWQRESNWNHLAMNSSSGAYGIPQSLPGSKMASVAGDWQTNPATQVTWGLNYISGRYGTPCGAWGHSQRVGWY